MTGDGLVARDRRVLWHPYAPATRPTPLFGVVDACGTTLTLEDGRTVVDGLSLRVPTGAVTAVVGANACH